MQNALAPLQNSVYPPTPTTALQNATFGAYASNTIGGSVIQGLWINDLFNTSGLGSATIQVLNGQHNHSLTDCSSYSNAQGAFVVKEATPLN